MSRDMAYIKLKDLLDETGDFSKNHEVESHTEKSRRFGQFYKLWDKDEKIAMKRIDPKKELDFEKLENELRKLGEVEHKNVVKLLGFCKGKNSHFIEEGGRVLWKPLMERILLFEFMPGGSLHDHIKDDSRNLDWPTCYNIIKGTCEGINHLHTKSILFLNIKPSNILLDSSNNAKVDGLNLSRFVSRKHTEVTKPPVSGNSVVPEKTEPENSEYDVKSLGDLVLELIYGKGWYENYCKTSNEEFARHVDEKWNKKSLEKLGRPLRGIESFQVKKCVALGLKCAVNDPKKRPSMKEIVGELEHDQNLSQLLSFPERPPTSGPRRNQHVVILYAFDCTASTSAWDTVDHGIFWMVQEKLTQTQYIHSCLGYVYFMMDRKPYYRFDMKRVDTEEKKATGYKAAMWDWKWCTENIQSGLNQAQELIKDIHGYLNSVILLFSDDALIKNKDFFHVAEKFEFKVPVHTFTLSGDKYNKDLEAIAKKSKGKFHNTPVPERPWLSERFPLLLDSIIDGTTFEEPRPDPETQQRLDVVLVYAFDSTEDPPAWHTMNNSIFGMVQERLARLDDSCMGFIYHNANPNNYITAMKVVDRKELKDYTGFDRRWLTCEKDMASGLKMANKMLRNHNKNGIILFFSDGLKNKGDFFDGTEDFKSEFPVHTFTLGRDAYNEDLEAIAEKSKGKFHNTPVPERPCLSERFSLLLDSIIDGTTFEEPRPDLEMQQRLDVVLVYAFDSTEDPPAWHTMNNSIFGMVQERLARLDDSCMGFIYHNANPNNYITAMKVVDHKELKDYTGFDRRWLTCEKDMASGLKMANKMLKNRNKNGIILFFSDGSINEGDFFDGTEDFKSEFPVHTFTLGGDAYNEVLQAIADKSGGTFDPTAVPEGPEQSVHFSQKLDSLLLGPKTTN